MNFTYFFNYFLHYLDKKLTVKSFLNRILSSQNMGGKKMEEFSTKKANHFKMLTVLAITASLSLGVYMHTAKDITISIDDEEKKVITYADTVEELLRLENIVLDKDAYINIPLDTKLENNMNIIIKTPKPYILTLGDKKGEIKSVHIKVHDILKDLNIELGEKIILILLLMKKSSLEQRLKSLK